MTYFFRYLLVICLCTYGLPVNALTILLCNDDGYQKSNIRVLYQKLKAAGHTVRISAPKDDQSGKSSSITFLRPVEIGKDETDESINFVGGTPVMAVLYGLDVLYTTPPDLVISGPNAGNNLGIATNLSGTVGAAVMALKRNVPAIAVSASSSEQNLELVADIVLSLVNALEKNRGNGALLPHGLGLNINIPNTKLLKGGEFTFIGSYSDATPHFAAQMGPYISSYPAAVFANASDPTGEKNKEAMASKPGIVVIPSSEVNAEEKWSEGVRIKAGYVTVSPMDSSYGTVDSAQYSEMIKRLSGLGLN